MDLFEQLERVRGRDRLLQAAWTGSAPMASDPDQAQALLDAAAAFERAGIGYMLIGGVAVAVISGLVRATQDVDFAVRSDVPRERIVEALTAAGLRATGAHDHSLQLVHGSGEPVQVAFDAAFDEPIGRAATCDVRGRQVRIATRDDLIAMKLRAAADPARRRSKALQDRADVEFLRGDVPGMDEGW